jgi:hypothetical protein
MDGIEVVHSHHRPVIDGQGIEVAPDSEKEVRQNNDSIYVSGPHRPGDSAEDDLKNPNKTICGLKPTLFWTLLAIALLVVIGAAVGGGVGGTLANRHTSEPSTTNG